MDHEQVCPLLALGPYLESQNSRMDSYETAIRHLQQRNEIFEDGLANIQVKLSESAVERSRILRPSNRSSESNGLHHSPTEESPAENTANANANATSYLLSVHESLREEVAQLSHAVRDLDARASMTIMNECLRISEDMAHTNAALGSMRIQIQWLMNPHLHYQARRAADMRDAGDSDGVHMSSAAGPSNNNGSNNAGYPSSRRLSDNGREGTKL